MIPSNFDLNATLLTADRNLFQVSPDALKGIADANLVFTRPTQLLDIKPGFFDFVNIKPGLFTQSKPEFESSYKGLIDGINDLSDQIDAKKAELEKPDLDPSQRMQLSIEMQELMQMRLQMITITTNLLKTDHDSAQAVNNNLRV